MAHLHDELNKSVPTSTDEDAGLLEHPDTTFYRLIRGFPSLGALGRIARVVLIGDSLFYRRPNMTCLATNVVLKLVDLLWRDQEPAVILAPVGVSRAFHPLDGVIAVHCMRAGGDEIGLALLLYDMYMNT